MSHAKDIKIGLLFSLTGTTSVTERGQYQSALLAIRQVNEAGGILGRRLVPVTEDIASDPILSAQKAEKLICQDQVAAIVGLYTSVCRKVTIPVLEKYNKLLFYPTLYEGEELSHHVFYCGPVPNQQLEYFIPWILQNIGTSVYLIGSDYVYPRETNKHIRRLVKLHGGVIVGEHYVPLGMRKFHQALRDLAALKPDVVFSTLVGDSAIAFYQECHHARLNVPIASGITGETEIQAMGARYAEGHYTSFPYFSSIRTEKNLEFRKLYAETYGTATISSVMESSYYSVWLLAEGIRKARSTETDAIRQALQGVTFEAPQGAIRVDESNQHLWLQSRIGRVNAEGDFDIVWESNGLIPPLPFYNDERTNPDESLNDDVSTSIQLLRRAQHSYRALIDILQEMTKYFPYQFAVFNPEGLTLAVFNHDTTGSSELPPFLHTGVRAHSTLLGHCGVTLALAGRSEAVVWGMEHEREELRDWITIGIPIQAKSGIFQGVLGVFIHDWPVSTDAVTILCAALKQVVENALDAVEERKRKADADQLLFSLVNALPEGYLSMHDGRILMRNSAAAAWLDDDPALPDKIKTYLQSEPAPRFLTRIESAKRLLEVRGHQDGGVYHLFLRRLRVIGTGHHQKHRVEIKDLVGSSSSFLKNLQLAELAAQMDANVLLLGESGTGKELFARAIHYSSSRRDKPFVAINCAGLPRDLLNAELFGYVDGAFTGAKRGGNPGKFELANGGTLFLDEIGDMPIDQQAVLLRVLQEKEVVRIGGTTPIPIDVRIISATNKRLTQEIAYNGSFRSDLYFRLNVFTINLTPLRHRKEDIPQLVGHFIEEFCEAAGAPEKSLSDDALQLLLRYSWPGNVRELRNAIERAFYLAGDARVITANHLPEYLNSDVEFMHDPDGIPDAVRKEFDEQHGGSTQPRDVLENTFAPASAVLRKVDTIRIQNAEKERLEIERTLMRFKGNISRCARELGISRTTLYRKLKEYRLM